MPWQEQEGEMKEVFQKFFLLFLLLFLTVRSLGADRKTLEFLFLT